MDARMIFIGQVTLAPVVLGVVLALVRGGTGRVVPALAVAALALLIAGVGIYDAITGLRSEVAYVSDHAIGIGQAVLNLSGAYVILGAGETLLLTATALALHDAARERRWGWFLALVGAQVLAAILVAAFNGSVAYLFYGWGPGMDLFQRVNLGDRAVSVPYYLVTSALIAASPVVALLYGLRARVPAPADAASAGTTAAA